MRRGHLTIALAAALAAAAPGPSPVAAQHERRDREATALASATREDLAHAYVRLERLMLERELDRGVRARVHRMFDAATPYFYWNRTNRAIEALNRMAALAAPDLYGEPAQRIGMSVRARVEPRVHVLRGGEAPRFNLERLYLPEVAPGAAAALEVALVNPEGERVAAGQFRAGGRDRETGVISWRAGASFRAALTDLTPGAYVAQVRHDGRVLAERPWYVVERPLEDVRAELLQRLGAVEMDSSAVGRAMEICRARIELLRDAAAPSRTSDFVDDLTSLVDSLRGEVAAIEAGRDPYRERSGEVWRVAPGGGGLAPMRVYAPPRLNGDGPHPLVVALHGAGGDEALFMLGYGAGMIKKLAEQFGFIVVTPRTESFFGDPDALDRIVDDLAQDYPIDRSRVYLVGHSLGAGAAATLARLRRDVVAAAVCIAGGAFVPGEPVAPTLSIPAELDPIIPAQRILTNVRRAVEAGARIELRLAEDQGHTLVVGEALPAAMEWLMQRRRGAAAAEAPGD